MTERPILFNGAMVCAILAGTKTQTRRIVTPHPVRKADIGYHGIGAPFIRRAKGRNTECPSGRIGDQLWVREAFSPIYPQNPHYNGGRPIEYDYRATYQHGYRLGDSLGIKKRWKPSIHMPRWGSRILLEITGVRVERLQEISEADAQAEGCVLECMTPTGDESGSAIHGPGGYIALWESIYGFGSWDANPWVWCVSFRRV